MSWHLSRSGKAAPIFIDDGDDAVYVGGVRMRPCTEQIEMSLESFQERLEEAMSMCEEPLKENVKTIIIDSLGVMGMPPKGMWKLPDSNTKIQKMTRQAGRTAATTQTTNKRVDNKAQMRAFVGGKR